MTFNEADHPRGGNPANTGEFTAKGNSGFEGVLPAWTQINPAFPEPQANSLEKVAAVVDAVAAGANTHEAIAETLDVTDREGAYYASAAGYLGLIDHTTGDTVTSYDVSAAGEQVLDATPQQRAWLMKSAAASTPGVDLLVNSGPDALEDYLTESGLDGTTVTRRAATIQSWWNAMRSDQFIAELTRESAGAESRSPAAAQRAAEVRAERVARHAEPDVRCPDCGNQVPLSGLCDWC